MSLNVASLAKNLFRRFTKKSPTCNTNRFRPMLECCEDRTTPTSVVTIDSVSDGREGSADVVVHLSRTDTSLGIMGSGTIGGTATAGSDYWGFGTFGFGFGQGQATTDVTITVADDTDSEPTETLTFTVDSGTGYTAASSAPVTAYLYDNEAQVVSVEAISDAAEGGTAGTFRFTRIGDLSSSLTANCSVGGTATSGTDYTSIGSSVTFAAGSATADVNVSAGNDSIYDPDETVSVTVTSGTGYSVGSSSSAELSITDDSSTVQTLIHQQTFQLAGSSGNVDVTLTVTYNAPGATGLYTWSYTVSNPSSNTSALSSFTIPIDSMDSDVGNLTSSIGWTGTVGVDSVSWAAGTGLSPGSSATFSFTTDPREIGNGDIETDGGGGFLADLPTAPAPREKTAKPLVQAQFYAGVQNYTVSLNIAVANGNNFTTGGINFSNVSSKQAGRDLLYAYLINNGWAVEKVGDFELAILGRVESDKSITAIKSLTYAFTDVSTGGNFATVPGFTAVGQTTVGPTP